MRLVQSDGSVLDLDVDRDPETIAAAQVSIGTLGVISTITQPAVIDGSSRPNSIRFDGTPRSDCLRASR
jgi:hypothetical protein